MNRQPGQSMPPQFLGLYGFANIGAHIAFLPLLSLLLPLKAELIAPDDKITLLSITLLAGAVMASIANVWGGMVSDKIFAKTGSRSGQIAISLMFVLFSYLLFLKANDWTSIILSILFFQLSFNFLFAPLGALLTDHVPNDTKGRASALLNLGMPAATFSVAILSIPSLADEGQRLSLISIAILLMITPLVLFIRKSNLAVMTPPEIKPSSPAKSSNQRDFIKAWTARLLVQFSGAVMFGYLLYFLQDVVQYSKLFPGQQVDQGLGKLSLAATPTTVLIGLLAGSISDRMGLRRPFLVISAVVVGVATLTMSLYPSWITVFGAYILFICGLTIFLTTDAALVAQLLSGDQNRVRKLGFMNLTNTIPAVLAPITALVLSGSGLQSKSLIYQMQLAGVFAICGALVASRIRTVA